MDWNVVLANPALGAEKGSLRLFGHEGRGEASTLSQGAPHHS